jgi:hypothetical protein
MMTTGRYAAAFGSITALRNMTPPEIGRRVLYLFQKKDSNGYEVGESPRSVAKAVSGDYGNNEDEVADLIMEGISWAVRTGLLIEDVRQMGATFFKLSRAGKEAVKSPDTISTSAADAEARTLLHPRIASEALHLYERGPDSYRFCRDKERGLFKSA